MREWYVYVPESVKAQPEKPVPLVFVLHGYTCAGEIYAGNSEWHKAADKHGFLVVHPTATPGQMEMENQVCSIQNVPLPALPADENDTGNSIRVWQGATISTRPSRQAGTRAGRSAGAGMTCAATVATARRWCATPGSATCPMPLWPR